MTDYRIVCTVQEPVNKPSKHAHIVKVGTNHESAKTKDTATNSRTLKQVVDGIDGDDTYHTIGTVSGVKTGVHTAKCSVCEATIIRTDPDDETDNNLDSLRPCKFKK